MYLQGLKNFNITGDKDKDHSIKTKISQVKHFLTTDINDWHVRIIYLDSYFALDYKQSLFRHLVCRA